MSSIGRYKGYIPFLAVAAFFTAYLLAGLYLRKDYGMYWDNLAMRDNAIIAWNYITSGDRAMVDNPNSIDGPLFQLFLYLPEKLLKITAVNEMLASRLTMNFLFYWFGTVMFYCFALYLFRSWKTALLGSVFLILTPRTFPDSFSNVKDMAIMAMFVISFFTMIRFLDKKDLWGAFLHAAASAALLATRIHGLLIPIITAFFVLVDIVFVKDERKRLVETITALLLYFIIFLPMTVLLWPFLWEDPAGRFIKAVFENIAENNYIEPTLYFGRTYIPRSVPWHYAPVWIVITTPILYLFLMAAGMAVSIKKIVGLPHMDYRKARNYLVLWAWVLVPIVLPIIFASPQYHAWRHHFFIYPALIILALIGFKAIWNRTKKKNIVAAVLVFFLVWTAFDMVRYHPYQNLYFNALVGGPKGAKFRFEMDYEGSTYKGALEYILRTDQKQRIPIRVQDITGRWQSYLLPLQTQARMNINTGDVFAADYFAGAYGVQASEFPYKNKVYEVIVDGASVCEVYKLR